MIPAQYLIRLPNQKYVRQSRLGSKTCKADEMQSYAGRKDTKKFSDARKTVYGPHSSETTPLLSADGTCLLTDKGAASRRQAEHFNDVLIGHHLSLMKLSTDYQT